MPTINFYLVRHGSTSGPAALNGHTDAHVTLAEQIDIAECVIAQLDFKRIITSPLSRCYELAQQVSKINKMHQPVDIEPRLMEIDFGDYDGVPFDDIPEQDWNTLDLFWKNPWRYPLPNAETMTQFSQRVVEVWQEILRSSQSDTLIVTHGGVIRVILAHLLGVELLTSQWFTVLQIANRSCCHIQVTGGLVQYGVIKSIGITL
jgi:alpha-ribazole phosphatase